MNIRCLVRDSAGIMFAVGVVFVFHLEGASAQQGSSGSPTGSMLEVSSWNCATEHGYVHVSGSVKNISGHRLEDVMVVGVFETESGEFVKSTDALIDYDPLLAGQSSPFKASTRGNPAIKRCYIEFRHLFGATIKASINNDPPAQFSPDLGREDVRTAQLRLNMLGYDAGFVDGILGPQTTAAVRAFQNDFGLIVDGEVNQRLLDQLINEPRRRACEEGAGPRCWGF